MENKIELGDKVKCKVTGFVGTVVAEMKFLNGCIQYAVASKVGKDNKMPEENYIDSQSLTIVRKMKPKPVEEEEEDYGEPTGGPNHRNIKQRGY